MRVQMAPGPDGGLFVSIPKRGGSVLALLARTGEPRPGWPIAVRGSTSCDLVLPVADGSVRVVCPLEDADGNAPGVRAFAFDSNAHLLAGWPVDVDGFYVTARVIGTDLALYASRFLGDEVVDGPTTDGGLVTVAADGVVVRGARVTQFDAGSTGWLIGPDGVAYGVGSDTVSQINAVDLSGPKAGWPVSVDGFASAPAFGPDGRIVVTAGSPTRGTSKVQVLDRDGVAVRDVSAAIPIVTVDESWGDTGGCPPFPRQPLIAGDGTIFLFSEADRAVVALDPSLKMLRGWPYRPATPLVLRDERYVKEDAYCPSIVVPAISPDSTVYLPLQARSSKVGGSLVAVGPNGRVRAGWPVELKRPGAEFWSVVVGSDGTVFALAIEPESSRSSSASILAIAPDGTVGDTTTIVNP